MNNSDLPGTKVGVLPAFATVKFDVSKTTVNALNNFRISISS